jgi:hypothetical protein
MTAALPLLRMPMMATTTTTRLGKTQRYTDRKPSGIAFSNKGKLAYVVHEQMASLPRWTARDKVGREDFGGNGKGRLSSLHRTDYAFISNRKKCSYVLDAANNKAEPDRGYRRRT